MVHYTQRLIHRTIESVCTNMMPCLQHTIDSDRRQYDAMFVVHHRKLHRTIESDCREYDAQNTVTFVGLFCKRDLEFQGAY